MSTFCEKAWGVAVNADEAPIHERGFFVAALVNHIRECETCMLEGGPTPTPWVCPATCRHADAVGVIGAVSPPCPGGYCSHYGPTEKETS